MRLAIGALLAGAACIRASSSTYSSDSANDRPLPLLLSSPAHDHRFKTVRISTQVPPPQTSYHSSDPTAFERSWSLSGLDTSATMEPTRLPDSIEWRYDVFTDLGEGSETLSSIYSSTGDLSPQTARILFQAEMDPAVAHGVFGTAVKMAAHHRARRSSAPALLPGSLVPLLLLPLSLLLLS